MEYLLAGILAALVITIILLLILLQKNRSEDLASKFNSYLKDQFLNFQSKIHSELSFTRKELNSSKDLLSNQTISIMNTIKGMGETIQKITRQQEEAEKYGRSLKDLLTAPKLRGNYGETILEEMLERTLPKNMWNKQYQIEKGNVVDAVVRMKDVIIPIDSKFPRDNYQRYMEAESREEKINFWRAYETDVKRQIKNINEKYLKPDLGTSDFALMFIPSEAIYYETIAEKNYLDQPSKIYDFAQKNKVLPVSPNTFYAFLQVIIIGVRNIEILNNAKKLGQGLISMEKSFELFYNQFTNIGKNLENAKKSFDIGEKHINAYKNRLDSTINIKELKDKGRVSEKELPGE